MNNTGCSYVGWFAFGDRILITQCVQVTLEQSFTFLIENRNDPLIPLINIRFKNFWMPLMIEGFYGIINNVIWKCRLNYGSSAIMKIQRYSESVQTGKKRYNY